jgi:hypothetical protein
MMKIYTPGHPPILETYIMYGIISALSRSLTPDEQEQIRVSTKGLFYEVEYSEELQINCSSLYDSILKAYNSVRDVEKFPIKVGLLGSLGFQKEEEVIRFASQAATVENIGEVYSSAPRESSKRESPCELHGEKLKVAQIPIAPMLGKYYSEHEASGVSIPKAMQYKICPLCLLFALEGLLKYSTIFLVRSKRSTSWIYSQLKPNITCGADKLNNLLIQNRLSKKAIARREFMSEIPEIVVPLLVFYVADSHIAMELSKLEPEFISYRLEVAGRAPAIRSYNTYNVKTLLEFISTIKNTNPEFENTIDTLRRNIDRCIDALTFLSISALVKDIDKFYNFLRLCSAYYGQNIKVRIPSEEEIHTATEWFYK